MNNTAKRLGFASLIALVATSALIFTATTASAQSTPLTATHLLPADLDFFIEIKINNNNPFAPFLKEIFGPSLLIDQTLTEKVMTNATISAGLSMDESSETSAPKMYLMLSMDQAIFQELVTEQKNKGEMEETIYQGKTIYERRRDHYFFYLNNLFINVETPELAQEIIDRSQNQYNTLAKNLRFQFAQSHFASQNFLNIYAGGDLFSKFASEAMGETDEQIVAMLKDMTGFGFSLGKTTAGYSLNFSIESKEQSESLLNKALQIPASIPHLYKQISGQNILFYSESSNYARAWEIQNMDSWQSLPPVAEWKETLKNLIGIDLEKELIPLLTKNSAIAIHANEETGTPSFTFISDVSQNISKMGSVLSTLNDNIRENTPPETAYELADINGTIFYHHTIEGIELYMGIDHNGILTITTSNDPAALLGALNGMLNNQNFADQFKNREESVLEISYIDYGLLGTALLNEPASTKPGDLFMKTYSNGKNAGWITGEIRLNFNVEDIGEIFENFSTMLGGGMMEESDYPIFPDIEEVEIIENGKSATSFCDVSVNNWFHEDVEELNAMGIIQGYSDNCFRPGQPVTRAEFVKMAYEVGSLNGFMGETIMSETSETIMESAPLMPIHFSDVPHDQWYSNAIYELANLGYIKGYNDGTFHPHSAISRAEAIQMLSKLHPWTDDSQFEPFTDVNDTDWFAPAVRAMYYEGMIKGTTPTTFEPHRPLNRAEAARLINQFLWNSYK